jgi:hypothetical protein
MMMERILRLRLWLSPIIQSDLRDMADCHIDWRSLELLCKLLKPFYMVTQDLQGEQYPTLSRVWRHLTKLRATLTGFAAPPDPLPDADVPPPKRVCGAGPSAAVEAKQQLATTKACRTPFRRPERRLRSFDRSCGPPAVQTRPSASPFPLAPRLPRRVAQIHFQRPLHQERPAVRKKLFQPLATRRLDRAHQFSSLNAMPAPSGHRYHQQQPTTGCPSQPPCLQEA